MSKFFLFLKRHFSAILVIAALLGVTFAVYSPCLTAEFVNWDDGAHLYDNFSVQQFDEEHIAKIFTSLINKTYIPLTMLSYSIEHHFFGLDPFVYHLDNIILHLLVTVFVFLLARGFQLSVMSSAIAAAVFALHPTRVESVAWVTERKDVLYAFFYVISLWCYQRYLVQFDPRVKISVFKYRYIFLTGIFGVLSLLAKPMALSWPLVLVLMDWFAGRKFDRRAIVEKIPAFVLTAAIAGVTYLANARVPGENAASGILVWCWTFVFYFRQFFVPIINVPLWVNPKPVVFSNPEYSLSVVLTVLIFLSVWKFRRHKWYVFAFMFFFLSVFFLLRFDDVADKNVVADRFLYLSSFGFCCLVGLGAARMYERFSAQGNFIRCAVLAVAGIALAVLAWRSYQVTYIWKNSKSLWVHQLKYFPATPIALNNLAIILSDEEEYQQALDRYKRILKVQAEGGQVDMSGKNLAALNRIKRLLDLYYKAIQNKPDYADAIYNLGNLYSELGDYRQAFMLYTQVIQLSPDYKEAYLNLAILYQRMGQDIKAVEVLEQYLSERAVDSEAYEAVLSVCNRILSDGGSPHIYEIARTKIFEQYTKLISGQKDSANTYFKLGYMYNSMGDRGRAVKSYQAALDVNPNYVDAMYNLGNVYEDAGDLNKALGMYRRVVRQAPQHHLAQMNLGVVYSKMGQLKEAEAAFQRSLEFKEGNADAYFNLGFIYEARQDSVKASEAYKRAIEINPRHAEAYYNLGNIYTKLKLFDKAKAVYRSAISVKPEHMDAMVNLSILAFQDGEYADAIHYLDEARVLGYDPPENFLQALEQYR